MTNYLMAMGAGAAVLMFWPTSRDRLVRQSSTGLAALVFSIGLLGCMSRLLLTA